jgi:hypothetical protein
MGRDATDSAINASLWALAFLIAAGTLLAFLVW